MAAVPLGPEGEAGFLTFEAFKRVFGRAGSDFAWHHIVEQNPTNLAKFGTEALHNSNNLIRIDKVTHDAITTMYNSGNIRATVSAMSFAEQYAEGIKILQDLDKIPY